MFSATWRPIIATLNYVFVSATEDAVFQRVIAGYNQCAQIAAKYEISECLDHIILSLAKISSLATETPPSTTLNTEVQASGKSIMVSKFAVDFGRDNKAELATLVLFRIINGHEGAIREGWTHVSFMKQEITAIIANFRADRSHHRQPLRQLPHSDIIYIHLTRSRSSCHTSAVTCTSHRAQRKNDGGRPIQCFHKLREQRHER
jgi:hypothetical protein